jgi:PIN domain nuclease of toxin-antitoxin system
VTGFLLDTNVFLWLVTERSRMRRGTVETLFTAPLFISIVTPIEMSIKMSSGKLPLPAPFQTDFGGAIRTVLQRSAIDLLALDLPVVEHLRQLPLHHRDPFDRIIIAQAFANGLAVATRDRAFFAYDGLEILEV